LLAVVYTKNTTLCEKELVAQGVLGPFDYNEKKKKLLKFPGLKEIRKFQEDNGC
jgi:hypothetical protein